MSGARGDDEAAVNTASGDPLADLERCHGPAARPERPVARPRPDGADDATVAAVGKLSEAREAMEDARGHLYAFHRLSGRADLLLQEAIEALRDAGHGAVADGVARILLGRDVLPGQWTFEIVEGYDAQYAEPFRDVQNRVEELLAGARPHVYEAEMKHREQRGTDASGG